jgi:murein L,D-transpeptidase YcbB/YkuD
MKAIKIAMCAVLFIFSGTIMAQTAKVEKKEATKKVVVKEKEAKTQAKGPSAAEIKKHSSKTLKVGSKGEAKKMNQKVLHKKKAETRKINKTEIEGKEFQKKKKLKSDGIVGPKTNN